MGDLRSFGMDDQSDESVLFIYRKTRELQPISVRRCFAIANKELQINEEIRDKEVRVIGAEGEQLGIMSSRDAYNMAQEKNLDLVKIAPQAQPPVCRIMDYGKYRFEQAKREKESRKNQKTIEVKETRLSLNIDTHDFDTKVNQTKKFLSSATASRCPSASAAVRWRIPSWGRYHAALCRGLCRCRQCGKARQAGGPQYDHVYEREACPHQ